MKITRRQFLSTLALSTLGLGVGTPAYAWLEGHGFGISRVSFALPRLKRSVRVAHLTDLHFGRWHDEHHIERWVAATLAQQPDLIVLTGDTVDGRCAPEKLEKLAIALEPLRAPLGVLAVLGNHDYGFRDTSILTTRLERVGVRYLINEGVSLRDDLYLGGVDDYWMGEVDSRQAVKNAQNDQGVLLLCHNPDALPKISSRVGLTLCGHTHGGQIRAPWGGLYSISRYGERFQMGFVQPPNDSSRTAFVSRGLGTTAFPVRTFCPAELVMLELQPG
jgi:uncharacterized protein